LPPAVAGKAHLEDGSALSPVSTVALPLLPSIARLMTLTLAALG
jgi:hypothetical protein